MLFRSNGRARPGIRPGRRRDSVVPSQRFEAEAHVTPFAVYRALRHVNPSPYLFFLRQSSITLIGSSPEILVRLEEERIVSRLEKTEEIK